ncbi:hypothetical protein [Saccharopolyspora flava]|uniref:Uncharacterized protein n=1 Tax=Saccharopolyspora flava TaxID=95161 RepID=A0A1I6P075_9PSEU|nr:hypothetical protein [Saccharopolyspora flava]SFS33594.1 hypothetical protein SAMN05660874_00320 [Saccharopolyspora flava]
MSAQERFAQGFVGLGGVVLVVIALVCAATGAVSPVADSSDYFASALTWLPQPAVNLVVAATGAVTTATAIAAARGTRATGLLRGASVLGLLALLGAGALAAVGYLPFLLVSAVAGHPELLRTYASAALPVQLLVAALITVSLWSWIERAARGEQVRASSAGTWWTWVAVAVPLAYAASRVLMAIGVPGVPMERSSAAGGLGLAAAAVGGAVLTWGLIRPWGERFPRWAARWAGRPVPVALAVVPALVASVLVLAGSRLLVPLVLLDNPAIPDHPLVWLPVALWPLWSVALVLAALHYRLRRAPAEVVGVR